MLSSAYTCLLVSAFLGQSYAQLSLPIIADPNYGLLSGESILKSQLGSWNINIGPIDIKLDLDLPKLPLKLPKVGLRRLKECEGSLDGRGFRDCYDPKLIAIKSYIDGLKSLGVDYDKWDGTLEGFTKFEIEYMKALGQASGLASIVSHRDRRFLGLEAQVGDVLDIGVSVDARQDWGDAENVARGERGDTEWFTYITVGTPPQSIPILPDTGSSDMFVFSTDCPSCHLNNHTAYNPSSSTSYTSINGDFQLEYADGSGASGRVGSDLITFGSSGSVSTSMTFGVATSSSGTNFRTSVRSGVLGLGQDGMSTMPNGTTLFSALINSGQLGDKLLGIRLEKGQKSRGVTKMEGSGAYVFGGMESSYVRGGRFGINWIDVTSSNYWGFPLDDISLGLISTLVGDQETPRRAIIDTGTSLIITSDQAAASIHTYMAGSIRAKSGVWYIPCTASYPRTQNLFFTIKGVRYGVPIEDLAWKASGVYPDLCISGVQGGMPYFTVLGDMFIKNHYVVLSYENDTPQVGLGDRTDVSIIL